MSLLIRKPGSGGNEQGREVCSDDACAEGRVTSVSSLLRSALLHCAVCSPSIHGNTLPDLKAALQAEVRETS